MSTPFLSFNPGDLIEDSHVEQFIEPIQNLEAGKTWFAEATGSTNAFDVTLAPAPSAYEAGMIVNFKANNNVTGATTINVNGLGAQSLQKEGNATLDSGDIVAGQMVSVIYDGSKFQMMSSPLNPTITVPSPTQNVLVYAETLAEQPTSTITTLSLPSFTFDSGKTYLLEMTVRSGSNVGSVRLSLSDGTSTHAYPSATTYVRVKHAYGDSPTFSKILPTLSGTHDLSIDASYMGSVQVRIYELNDNLVYADFSPAETGATVTSYTLEDFTAEVGHNYLLVMSVSPSANAYLGAGCYLTNGSTTVGLPHSDPTTQVVKGPYYSGIHEVSKMLTGLSGIYDVVTRRNYAAGVSVRIYDIT